MFDIKNILKYYPHIVFFVIVFAIMFPLFFKDGFIFLLDMVWGPNIHISSPGGGVPGFFPLILIFKFLSFFLPASFIQKALLFTILYLSGFSMFTLAKRIMPRKWATLSGVFYILNPYVFERFLSGQWLVILGYAFFPLVVFLFLRFLKNNSRKNLLSFILAFSIFPILSMHWAYISFWFLLLTAFVYFFKYVRSRRFDAQSFLKSGQKSFNVIVLQLVLLLVINSFWLFNFFGPSGILEKITLNDFKAFQTQSDPVWGVFFNVLSLYGFWQDSFFLPKDVFSFWWILTFAIAAFSFIGFYVLAKKRNVLALTTGIAFIPALLIGVGYGSTYVQPLCNFLFHHLPGFVGLRETEKVAGILAFAYALFFPLGVKTVFDYFFDEAKEKTKVVIDGLSVFFVLIVCCLLVNNMFFGFSGQIESHPYPASWYAVEKIFANDPGTENVLFLPWHGYPQLAFAGNITVANPAQTFFSSHIISGRNLDNVYLEETAQGDWDTKMFNLLQNLESIDEDIGFLKSQKVNYIILAKTSDWERYGFLDKSQNVRKVYEADEIVLYKVN